MKANTEKFTALVSNETTNTIKRNRDRIKSRNQLRESQNIAMMVLERLDEWNWSQRQLATAMEVSPQQITKIVRGSENLTLDTIIRLQTILKIKILASYQEADVQPESIKYKIEEKIVVESLACEPEAETTLSTIHQKIQLKYDESTSAYCHERIA